MEILQEGPIQVRLVKQVVDGTNVITSEYHRFVLEPGATPATLWAAVNTHLGTLGWPPVSAADMTRVGRIVTQEHTPEVIADFRAKQAARRRIG
jgi:hypothetical protein